MSFGPVEMVVIGFPDHRISPEIRPRVAELVERGIVRIIDALVIRRDADGTLTFTEVTDVPDDPEVQALAEMLADPAGLLSEDDVEALAAELTVGTAALALVFEHTWMAPVREAVLAAGGRLLADIQVPGPVADEVLAAAG